MYRVYEYEATYFNGINSIKRVIKASNYFKAEDKAKICVPNGYMLTELEFLGNIADNKPNDEGI